MPYTLKPNKLFVKDPNGTGYLPQNVVTDRTTDDMVAEVNAAGATQISAIGNKGSETLASIPNDYTALTGKVDGLEEVLNGTTGLQSLYEPYIVGPNGTWTQSTASHICIPVHSGDVVNLVGNTNATYYCVLRSKTYSSGGSVDYSTQTGFTDRILLEANGNATLTIPSDGRYLYAAAINGHGQVIMPASIKINDVELTYNIRKKIDEISESIYQIDSLEDEIDAITEELHDYTSSNTVPWIYKIMASQPSAKTIHFSLDDVTFLSELLADPAPSSIWDLPEFAALEAIHENSGACITLMCFNELDSYDISLIPNTWASEFQAAKPWLRFGFHAKTDGTKYSIETTGAEDYTKFVNAVHKFTGDYGCIDRFPRLGYFAGTLAQCRAMAELNYGPLGFLTADDVRLSYYLNQAQNDFVNTHGRLFDYNESFIFVPTITRLDAYTTSQTGIDAITARGAKSDMYIEIFCHATGSSSTIVTRMNKFTDIATWATQHGYVHGFLMDYFE